MKRKHESPGVYIYEYSVINKHRTGKRLTREKMEQVSSTEVSTEGDSLTYKLKVIPTTATLFKNKKIELKAYLQLYRNNVKLNETEVTSECEYQSYNDGVEVNAEGVVTALKTGSHAIIKVSYNDKYEAEVIIDVVSEITYRLEVIPKDVVLAEGDTQQFIAKLYTTTDGVEDNGVDVTKKCTWKSSNINVPVSPTTGLVTITKTGVNSTITAIYNEMNNVKGTANIVVNSVSKQNLRINGSTNISLTKGQTHQFKVKLYTITDGSSDNGIDVTSQCKWSSSNSSQIQVNGGLVSSSELNATTVITAEYNGMSVMANVTYSSEVRYELVIEPSSITINVGEEKQLYAKYYTIINGERSDFEDVTDICRWYPETNGITVQKGIVSSTIGGISGKITATYLTATATATVYSETTVSYQLDVQPNTLVLAKGETDNLKAILYTITNGAKALTYDDVTSQCEWKSDNNDIKVTKNTDGKGVAVTSNVANVSGKVTAIYDNKYEDFSMVTFSAQTSYELVVEPSSLELTKGQTGRLTAIYYVITDGVRDNGTDVTSLCKWTPSNNNITINSNGDVVSIVSGIDATITASYSGKTVTVNVKILSEVSHRLAITPTTLRMNVNDSKNLNVTYYTTTDGMEDQGVDVTDICEWDIPVGFTVDNGTVLATKPGASGTITASYDNLHATCDVVCENQMTYGLVLDTTSVDISVGGQKQIIAYYVTYKNGEEIGRLDVTDTGTWKPSHTHIKVDKGKITLNGYGESGTVTVSYNGFEATVNVNVISTVTEKLIIEPSGTIKLSPKQTKELKAYVVTEDNGVEKGRVDVSLMCSWSSSNTDVSVLIGTVGTQKGGVTSTITAAYSGLTASVIVKYSDLLTYELVISPEYIVMNAGETYQFKAELVEYKNGVETKNRRNVTTEAGISWDCGNTNEVGTINGGLFKPVKSGMNVTINAVYSNAELGVELMTSNNVTAVVNSNVKYELVSVPNNITLDKDFIEHLTVNYRTITDGVVTEEVDVTEQCTFTSNNENMATVDAEGAITAVGNNGNAVIGIQCFISNIDETLTTQCNVTLDTPNLGYMYIKTLENDTTISFSRNALQFSINEQNNWQTLEPDTPLTVGKGRVYFKGTDLTIASSNGIGSFSVSKPFEVGGSSLSLILGDDYDKHLNLEFNVDSKVANYQFASLFLNSITLQRVSKNFLPLRMLPQRCYYQTFQGCRSLRNAPELLSANITWAVYAGMFSGCISLRKVPTLNIKALASGMNHCENMFLNCSSLKNVSNVTLDTVANASYMGMFAGCTSLKIGANITATQIAQNCYRNLYNGCRNLKYIKMLALTINDDANAGHLTDWVRGVPSTGTFVKHKDATWDIKGNSGVPEGWEIIYEDNEGNQTSATMVSGYITTNEASTYSLRRSVSNSSLGNVNVGVYGTIMTTTTDENGYYEFPKTSENFENGSLICYANGYEPQIIDINGNNNVDVAMAPQVYDEMFEFDYTVLRVSVFDIAYSNFIRIDVPGKTKDVVNEFEISVNDEAKAWLGARSFRYIVPTKDDVPIADLPPYLSCDFDVAENKGRERVGYIKVQHSGGWSGTFTVIQNGALLPNDIPSDAFKVVRPGVTPWFMTRDQEVSPDYNWGRAEKVLYINNELKMPSGSVYVPGVTEHTTVQYYLSEIDEYSSDLLSSWCFDIGKNEGWWDAPNYNGFNHYGVDIGPRSNFDVANATHRTVVITFLVKNYNNTIGNYMAFDVRIVQCKNNITEKEFNEIVAKYGSSNYDGTMNNLSRFSFGELPTPDKVIRGTTPYVTTYEWTNGSYSSPKFGECDRVLYLTNKKNMVAFEINYPDGIEYVNSTVFSCRDGEDNVLENWLKRDGNGNYTIGSTTDFIPKNGENHRVINFNFTFYFYQDVNKPYKRYDIPFKVVQCKEGITYKELAALVAKYGTSNYDGTMGRLDAFEFWREKNNIDINNLIGTWVDKNNTTIGMTIIKRNGSYTFLTGPSTFVGEFNLQISENDEVIIVGSADQNNNEWKHKYILQELTETTMKWVATDDKSIIYEYIKA